MTSSLQEFEMQYGLHGDSLNSVRIHGGFPKLQEAVLVTINDKYCYENK